MKQPLIQYLLLFLAVLCVYLPTLWYGFVWDDTQAIQRNTSVRHWSQLGLQFTDANTFAYNPNDEGIYDYRPLRNIYFILSYQLHGLNPAGWHFNHVLLQCLASCCVLALIHRLLRLHLKIRQDDPLPASGQLASWLSVFAWSVHPVNTEVIAWLKCVDDIQSVICFCFCLILLLPADKHLTTKRIIGAGFLFFAGLLFKVSIAPLVFIYPTLALGLSPSIKAKLKSPGFLLSTATLFISLLAYLIVRKIMLGKIEQMGYIAGTFVLMMATMLPAFIQYLKLIFWPWWPTQQIGDYLSWPIAYRWNIPETRYSLCVLLALLVIVIVISRRNRLFGLGIIVAIFAFLPVSNIIPMMQVMAERFLYFPLIGLVIAASAIWAEWIKANKWLMILPAVICLALLTQTQWRLPVWLDEQKFQKSTADSLRGSWRSTFNYALTLRDEKNTTLALARMLEAQQIYPTLDGGLIIADLLGTNNHADKAIKYLDKMTTAYPESEKPIAYKALFLQRANQMQEAYDLYTKALEKNPNYIPALIQKSFVSSKLHKAEEASTLLEKAYHVSTDPRERMQLLELRDGITSTPIKIE